MDNNDIELRISVNIRRVNGYGGSLDFSETAILPPMGFLAVAQCLGRFNDLAETIRAEVAASKGKQR